jgi:nitronate monooxygenase
MNSWPDSRILELLGIELPIIQAPMAGSVLSGMVIAVSEAGGLGSLPCAMLSPEQMRTELTAIRQRTSRPINVNFFCHRPPQADEHRETTWRQRLASYYVELELDPEAPLPSSSRTPFDTAACDLVLEFKPEVVSFHFGLPAKDLLTRVRSTGAKILSSATTVDEARWLENEGCDVIIAQGYEAGGHRGMFLDTDICTQVGTMALVPQVVDAVKVPVIAAGGIADSRGIAAAFALGASAVQIGTAYLFCPEAKISSVHRRALRHAKDNQTVLTNVFSGRPARGILNRIVREVGPVSELAPEFPLAARALAPLRSRSEAIDSDQFVPLWSGQAAHLARELPAGELTAQLAADTLMKLHAR